MNLHLEVPGYHDAVSHVRISLERGAAPTLRLALSGGVLNKAVGSEATLSWSGGSVPLLVTQAFLLPNGRGIELCGIALGSAARDLLRRPSLPSARSHILILQRRVGQPDAAWLQVIASGLAGEDGLRELGAAAGTVFSAHSALARPAAQPALQAAIDGLRAVHALGGPRISWRLTEDAAHRPLRIWSAETQTDLPKDAIPTDQCHEQELPASMLCLEGDRIEPSGDFWSALLTGNSAHPDIVGALGPMRWNGLDIEIQRVVWDGAAGEDLHCCYDASIDGLSSEVMPPPRSLILKGTLGDWVDPTAGLVAVKPAGGAWAVLSSDGKGIDDQGLAVSLLMPAFGEGGGRQGLHVCPKPGAFCNVLLVPGATPVLLGSPQTTADIGALTGLTGDSANIAKVLTVGSSKVLVEATTTIKGDLELEA